MRKITKNIYKYDELQEEVINFFKDSVNESIVESEG